MGPNVQLGIRELLAAGDAPTSVVASWVEYSTSPTIDPVSKAKIGGTPTTKTHSFKAFSYEVSASQVQRNFSEVLTGDLILSMEPADYAHFSSQSEVVFTINGKSWVQAEVGDKLSAIWDVTEFGSSILSTILLRPIT